MSNKEAEHEVKSRLIRQWLNGNRKDVAEALANLPRKVTLYFGATLAKTPGGVVDLDILATLLSNHD